MRKLTVSILAALLLLGTAAALASDSIVGYVPDRIIVVLDDGYVGLTAQKSASGVSVDIPAMDALGQRYAVHNMERLYRKVDAPEKSGDPDLRLHWAVDFSPQFDPETVRKAYEALPEVKEAWKVAICRQHVLPNDPGLVSQQWYLRNSAIGQKDVRAVGGWAEATGDTSIIVAITDSGLDWMHPDLGGTGPDYIDGDVWINWEEWNGTPGVDDDSNGYVDDFRGWDFVTGVTGYPDEDVNTPDNDPMDYESHGTNCAGIAGAITNNGLGIAGAGFNCRVMAIRVGWLPSGQAIGVVRMDFASQGMIYAANNGAKIVNCSWGSTSYLSSAVSYCVSHGMIIVTSAGNDNDEIPSYLGASADVLAVAATDQDDHKASFSDYGVWVDLSAPGVGMYTTYYDRFTSSHTYTSVDGTSFSSPTAAGCAALIWSAHPGWSRTQVMAQLMNTCDDLDAINPAYAGKLGAGRINLLRALGDNFLEVPDEFPVLFDALNEGAGGDTVAVLASQVVSGPVTVLAREYQVLGGYAAGYGSRDPVGSPTVINGLPTGPVLRVQAGATLATVVDGFRCTGGAGTQLSNQPFSGKYGGGILCSGSSPTLRNLEVTGNAVGSSSQFGGGGGVYLFNSSALLDGLRIYGNSAVQGAGVFIYQGTPTLSGCEIYENTPVDNASYQPLGGGVCAYDANVTMTDCHVHNHDGLVQGGGVYASDYAGSTNLIMSHNEIDANLARDGGGGLFMSGASLQMQGDELHDNGMAAGASYMRGGGLNVTGAEATLDTIICRDNSAQAGAGIYVENAPQLDINNSLVVGNSALFFGGGILLQSVASSGLIGNTIADNSGSSGGGGLQILTSSPVCNNNIVAFNTGASQANGFNVLSGTPSFVCNDVYGNDVANYGGIADQTGVNGNFSEDPEFCNAPQDYSLKTSSPCTPENSGGCELLGALPAGTCFSPVPDPVQTGVPAVFKVEPSYPNPFNPSTKIVLHLPEAAETSVRIYDISGRLVRTLVDGRLDAAVHELTWQGRDDAGRQVAAGVYFYRVRSGVREFTGRMALVK